MKLIFQKYGEQGPGMLILHGLLGSAQNWTTVARHLAQSHTVYVPDLRNHGNSPHGAHTFEGMVDDILQLMRDEDIRKPLLIGHSMGGLVGMTLATFYPNRLQGLVVVDIAPVPNLNRLQGIIEAMVRLDLSTITSRADADARLAQTIASKTVRQFLLTNLKREENGSYRWKCNLAELHRFVSGSERFELPQGAKYAGQTLFIAGGKSDHRVWTQEELIRQHFPAARLKIIPHAGHWIHFEAREDFLRLVNEFAATLEK